MVGIKLKEFQEKCVEELLEANSIWRKKGNFIASSYGKWKNNNAIRIHRQIFIRK